MAITRFFKGSSKRPSRGMSLNASRRLRSPRALNVEQLEDRRVLSGQSPLLVGVVANGGTELVSANEVFTTAPNDLKLVFTKGLALDPSTFDGISLVRSGFDGEFTESSVNVPIGSALVGEDTNEVILRFAEELPDDTYQIRLTGEGENAVQTLDGCAINNGVDSSFPFELDLGAQVLAVVPQPIERNADNTLTQHRNRIDIYLNDDDLAIDPMDSSSLEFFKLIYTGHAADDFDPALQTLTDQDDITYTPESMTYDAEADKIELTFANDLHQLAGEGAGATTGTYRLRIGSTAAGIESPRLLTPGDAGSSFTEIITDPTTIGVLDSRPVQISAQIDAVDAGLVNPLVYPGSNNDPGHRQVGTAFDSHILPTATVDTSSGVPTVYYNFKQELDPSNPIFRNLITENQKDLARQVFELYAHYLGVTFVETDTVGITVATGDVSVVGALTTDPDLAPGAAAAVSGAPTAVMNAGVGWSDEFGGDWFQESMQQVGKLLGLGAANDLPEGTIAGGNSDLTFGRGPEPVFPGDHDIVHGRHLFRPDADDIDLYRFEIQGEQRGVLSIEAFAERLLDAEAGASSLDTVIRVYRETDTGARELIAQNDDYFGSDSFTELEVSGGVYYVGVSSKGNDQYNPEIDDSGSGGISEGRYDLRLDFRPEVSSTIVDTTGRLLDGDGDGLEGGNHNFWFRVQTPDRTLLVDKFQNAPGDGSEATPYNSIRAATDAAAAGDIIRVVGNNFEPVEDPEPGEEPENLLVSYEIGIGANNVALADGGADGSLRVPKGVTLMVDEGASFKLRRGAIVVGSSSQFVDTSGSAIQVLGTPSFPVEFTSLNETPLNGDWGGIVVRNDVDNVTEGHFRYEDQGIFLNYINFADMQYGGGIVSNGFIDAVISPITIVDARPTVTNNRLTNNSDAAIAASPNSFLESNFRDPGSQSQQAGGFTLDYGRVGPMVQSNLVVGNTINGMVIGDRFRAPSESNVMTVAGRWDDTSITHVLQDSLQIVGNSGGNSTEVIDVGGVETLREIGRPDASLVIDPATVVKLDSVAISVDVGATLLAEGTEVRPVVVTSLQDSRYGAGGTYTTSEGEAASGDWGGIYIAPTAIASFDHAILAYGGGVVTVPGTFTGINVIESHQGDLRITNSLFELNANGIGGAASEDRGGLGLHEAATVFVSGSQPVIIDNAFRGNEAAIVSINVNSLNHFVVTDRGRSRGPVDASNRYQDNLGPLVRNNQMDDNAINGMVVRGGTLTTESTWDDTDVVHVVLDSIYVPTFHSYGGLRLKSSIDSSLVVKLLDAEIVATGSTAGVADFIGGGVQVLGQLGRPVVMTSFFDDTVGAGFDAEGRTVVDTDGGRRPMRTSDGFDIQLNFGPAISADPEIMAAAELAASIWEAQIQDPITVSIDVDLFQPADPTRQCLLAFTAVCGDYTPNYAEINNDVDLFDTDAVFLNDITYSTFRDAAIADAGAHEELIGQLPTAGELQVDLPFDSLDPYSFSGNTILSTANAKALNLATTSPEQSVYVAGAERDGTILINQNRKNWDFDTRNGLSTYREDFQSNFLREIGKILGFNSSFDTVAFTPQRDIDLAPLDLFRFDAGEGIADFTNAVRRLDPTDTTNKVFYAGGDLDFTDFPVEGISLGEIPISTSQTLGGSSWTEELLADPVTQKLTVLPFIGVMDAANVYSDELLYFIDPQQGTEGLITEITEADRLAFDSIGYDVVGAVPGQWGGINIEQLANDRNVAIVSEFESTVSGENDLPSTAEAIGTLAPSQAAGDDNTRLGFEIQGLLASNDDVDVYRLQATALTEAWLDIDQTSPGLDTVVELISPDGSVTLLQADLADVVTVNPLLTQLGGSAEPLSNDIYSLNTFDSGARVTLPGTAGTVSDYFIRVRSNGSSSGRYELQVRLQAEDEVPGTTVINADLRYATTGINIVGPPVQSPLLGEHTETGELNDGFEANTVVFVAGSEDAAGIIRHGTSGFLATSTAGNDLDEGSIPYDVRPQHLGNLLASNQGVFSVFGTLSGNVDNNGNLNGFEDIDWYRFNVDYGDLAVNPFASPGQNSEVTLAFDVDYADGLGRPDVAIAVYDEFLGLRYYSDDSTIDLVDPSNPADLSTGSFGSGDPFIGPVTVPAGIQQTGFSDFFGINEQTYYVAVMHSSVRPAEIAGGAPTAPVLGDPNRGLEVLPPITQQFLPEFDVPLVPPTNVVSQGEYQLEIRVVGTDGATDGDLNRARPQGQIVVSNSSVTDSSEWGISVDSGLRNLPEYRGDAIRQVFSDADTLSDRFYASQPHTQFNTGWYSPAGGAPRALPGLNEERLVPGLTISNNLVARNGLGAVQMQGDPNGVVLRTYDFSTDEEIGEVPVEALEEIIGDLSGGAIDGRTFTIWDHQRNSQIFEFDTDGALSTPGSVGVRFNLDAPADRGTPPFASLITSPESPTLARYIADEIEHAIRFSDLDVKVYRGTDQTMYIEGAIEIGEPDFDVPPTAFFIRDQNISELPLITSEKAQQGGVPYTRLVNNTLVGLGADASGESEFADIGVMIEDNASPTLLNNIVAYFDTGILADLSANDSTALRGTYVGGNDSVDQVWLNGLNSLQTIPMDANFAPYGPGAFEGLLFGAGFGISGGSFNTVLPDGSFILNHTLQDFDSDQTRYEGERATVVGATVFKANRDNVERIGKGDFAIELGVNDPLFVDAASGNYLLTSGSQAIDSSVSDVPERIPLNQVLSNINVTSEGISAPSRDAMGLERFDDPAIENQNGTGSNAFIDRGAFERADFVDPSARLVNPLDGGPDDADAAIDTVQVFNQVLTSFEIELTDRPSPADPLFGSGIDDATVNSAAVTVRRDDVELVEGEDYSFSYNIVADTIRLTPVTGIWEPDFVYTVTIDNTTIMDRSQNTLRGNQPDGTTVFLIGTGSGLDYGDAPGDYPTTRAENGASHASVEGVFLGAGVDVEVEAKDVDSFDDGVTFSGDILIGGTSTVEVVASTGGFLNAWMDFDGDGAWSGGEQVFSNEPLAAGVNSLIFNVPSGSAAGSTFARFRFDTTGGLEPTGPAADGEVEDYELNLLRNPWTNDNPLDVNNDSFPNGPDEPANALDALTIINVLTRIADGEEVPGVDGATGRLEIPRPADAEGFYDVNGDGFVTPLDALVVINRLENTAESAVQAPLSGGVTAGFQLDQRADDEEESLDDVIGQFAGEVGEAWSAE